MRSEDVARYLQDNPQFFEDYAELLSQMVIPHPHGGRAISITERQILTLREKSRQVETKLAELIRFGEENDAIAEKVHRLGLALIAATDLDTVLLVLKTHLVEDFAVPHVALRLWLPGGEGRPEFEPVSEEARAGIDALAHPYCGPSQGVEAARWFGEIAGHLRSVALVPLPGQAGSVGALALASEDPERFYPEMGTLYLARIGELAGAALARTMD